MSETPRKLRIFKSTMPMVQFVFAGKDADGKSTGIAGKSAAFIAGEYRTDIKAEIAELEHEIELKHQHIYIDPERYEMDAEDVDPTIALKKKHFAEFEAMQKAAMNKGNTGKSEGPGGAGTGIGTSAGTNAGAQDSNSVPGQSTVAPGTNAKVSIGASLASLITKK